MIFFLTKYSCHVWCICHYHESKVKDIELRMVKVILIWRVQFKNKKKIKSWDIENCIRELFLNNSSLQKYYFETAWVQFYIYYPYSNLVHVSKLLKWKHPLWSIWLKGGAWRQRGGEAIQLWFWCENTMVTYTNGNDDDGEASNKGETMSSFSQCSLFRV